MFVKDMMSVDEFDGRPIYRLDSMVSAMHPARRGSEACSRLVPPEQPSTNLTMVRLVD
jgi:hypothetical protein